MGESAQSRVFLSYRREDTKHAAGRLADRIAERFSSSQVFVDVDSIPPGVDFSKATQDAIRGCDVLLALIGPRWTTLEDSEGRRRLDDPEDFVVLELRAALDRGIPVIPVLVDGAHMPKRAELPPGLEEFTRRNAVRLDAESFRQDVGWLLTELAKILPAAPSGGARARLRASAGRARVATKRRPRARPDDGRSAEPRPRRPEPKVGPDLPARRKRWRRALIVSAAALVLAAAAAAALLAGDGDRQDSGGNAASERPVSFGEPVQEPAIAQDAVWTLADNGRIMHVAPGGQPIGQEAPVGTTQLAAGPAGVWSGGDGGLQRVDDGAHIPLDDGPTDIAVGDDGVWVLVAAAEQIVWIARGQAHPGDAPPGALAVATGADDAWLLDRDGLVRAMRSGDKPVVLSGGRESGLSHPDSMAADGGTVWVLDREEGALARLDHDATRAVVVARDLRDVTGIAAGRGALWLSRRDGTVAPFRP